MTQHIAGEGGRSLNLKLLSDFFMQKPAMSYLLLGLQLTHWMPMENYENTSLSVILISEQ